MDGKFIANMGVIRGIRTLTSDEAMSGLGGPIPVYIYSTDDLIPNAKPPLGCQNRS